MITFLIGLSVGGLIGVLVTSILMLEKEYEKDGREKNVCENDNRQ